jgi:uncharacterized protein involved in outer membrane biogenesis
MRMPSSTALRELALRHRWKLAGAFGLWVAWLLFGWFAVPRLVEPRLERAIGEATGHPTTIGAMEFDPLGLAVTLHDLRIATPGGATVISASRLFVDFETRSLFDWAWNFKALDIDEPYLNVELRADGALNLGDLAGPPDATPAPTDAAPAAMPRLIIQSFAFRGGKVDWRDLGMSPPLATSFPNLALSLTDFSTLPDDRGEYALQASGPSGGVLVWRGSLGVNPLASQGRFTIEGMSLPTGFDLVEQRFAYDVTDGMLRASIDYSLADAPSGVAFLVTDASATVERFALGARGGPPLVALPLLAVSGVQVDLPRRTARVGEVRLEALEVTLAREAEGIDLIRLLTAPPPDATPSPAAPAPAAPAPAAAAPWRIALERFALVGARVALTDRTLPEPGTVTVAPLDLALTDAAFGPQTRFTVALDATVNDAGRIGVSGPLTGTDPAGTLALKVEALALAPFEPWLRPLARIELPSGALGVEGELTLTPASERRAASQRLKGYAEVADLRVRDARLKQDLLRWKRLQLRGLEVVTAPQRVRIEEIVAEQPYLRFLIGADGSTNLQGLVVGGAPAPTPKPATAALGESDAPAGPSAPKPAADAAPLPLEIKRVRVLDGSANFADQSLEPDFATGIQSLTGSIVGLSSQEAKRAEIVLDGKVDRYAPVAIRGKVNLFAAETYSDVTMSFRDIELTTFTPYAGKFAGYKIDKGRLSLDIRYQLEDRYIRGQHKVVLDQLTLGERVDSADAMSLPIKLALALLKDSRGVIDLELPVEGSIDDPQFKVGPLVWKAVVSLFTKIVTAPFAALGALFGGDADLSKLAFAAGSATLDPAATARLDTLAKGLAERPALRLDVRGVAAPIADGALLARRQVLDAVRPDGSADALIALTPKELKALLAIHAQRFGAEPVVAGLAEGQKATPEQVHAAALEALATADGVAPEALRALAQARAAAVKDYLVTRAMVPAERVFLLDADSAHAAATGQPVEMTLALGAE